VPESDGELMEAFKRTGSQDTLAQLYLRYSDLVYGTCLKYLKDGEAAKDAVMNIYQELLNKLQNHEVGNFRGWLHVVAKNHCLMHLREAKKTFTIELPGDVMQLQDFSHLDGVLGREEDFKKLEKCMQLLQEQQKQVVNLFYLQNKCYNEIVEQTGFDWGRVRSLVQNARRNLKICMEKNG
jgi:RNA polymerase sigma-70 factor (ECF subfamily)